MPRVAKKVYEKPKLDLTIYTYAEDWVLDRRTITEKHLQFYADNCRKLADYMEKLPDEKHIQGRWVNDNLDPDNDYGSDGEANVCGTPACALGHAAHSNLFAGLQLGVNGVLQSAAKLIMMPVINGGRVAYRNSRTGRMSKFEGDWAKAGRYFFGDYATTDVFEDGSLSKERVVKDLRNAAEFYESRLKEARDDRDEVLQDIDDEIAVLQKQRLVVLESSMSDLYDG